MVKQFAPTVPIHQSLDCEGVKSLVLVYAVAKLPVPSSPSSNNRTKLCPQSVEIETINESVLF